MYHYATDPADVPVADVMVQVHGFTRGMLRDITQAIGGEAYWVANGIIDDGYCEFEAFTLVEAVEGYDVAKEIVSDLIHEHLGDAVDLDNLFMRVLDIADDEDLDSDYDW